MKSTTINGFDQFYNLTRSNGMEYNELDTGENVISSVAPDTDFETGKAVLRFYFSEALVHEGSGLKEINRFIENSQDEAFPFESRLVINVDYDKIPDRYLQGYNLFGSEDDGCYHVEEAQRGEVEKMIAGLEAALKTLKEVKFHPNGSN